MRILGDKTQELNKNGVLNTKKEELRSKSKRRNACLDRGCVGVGMAEWSERGHPLLLKPGGKRLKGRSRF